MKYSVFASGSKGNCALIRAKNTNILIDCGISAKRLKDSLAEEGLVLDDIDAVLFTHSHSDHIKGALAVKDLEVYSPFEIKGIYGEHYIEAYKDFTVKDIDIMPIKLSHDAPETLGYILQSDETLVYVTDTGYISNLNQKYIEDAEYYIFEANHDVELLMNTNRPPFLKARILSDSGHMNNEDAGIVLAKAVTERTKEIVLAHLSEQANDEKLALDTVRAILTDNGIDLNKVQLKAARQNEIVRGGKDD